MRTETTPRETEVEPQSENTKKEVRVAAIQFQPKRRDPESNRAALLELLLQAVNQRAQIAVCPEMATSGYLFDDEKDLLPFAEKAKGATFELFSSFAHEHGIYLAYGYPELCGKRLYNAQNLIAPSGELAFKYRKKNLYHADKRWTSGGSRPYGIVDSPFGKIGLGICMDLNSDAFLRRHFRLGTRFLLFSANWEKGTRSPMFYWKERWKLFPGVAVFANRHGRELETDFCGRSSVFENRRLIASLTAFGDRVLVTSHQVETGAAP